MPVGHLGKRVVEARDLEPVVFIQYCTLAELVARRGNQNRNVNDAAPLVSRAESAHKIDDEADQQNQPKRPSTDSGPTEIKSAATEQEEKNDNHE